MEERTITLAKSAGFCFGVRRAVQIAEKLGKDNVKACTLGPIIHNTHVVEYLRNLGVPSVDTVEEIPDGTLAIIRSHGVPASICRSLEEKGLEYEDATCPYVKKNHGIISENVKNGAEVVIIAGDRNHPEVKGIKSCAKGESFVIGTAEKIDELLENRLELSEKNLIFVLFYGMNDVVLIMLWVLAATEDVRYISVVVCFIAFLVNDLYGYISWKKMEKRQGVAVPEEKR